MNPPLASRIRVKAEHVAELAVESRLARQVYFGNPQTVEHSTGESRKEKKMTARIILSCKVNSHPFDDRVLLLDVPVKIGRAHKEEQVRIYFLL